MSAAPRHGPSGPTGPRSAIAGGPIAGGPGAAEPVSGSGSHADPEALEDQFHPAPTWLENGCMAICAVAIIIMGAIVILEIVTRNLFGFSFEISEEIGGYIIVGISFLSLPVCQVYRSYHHVQFVQARLSPRMRALSHVIFDALSLLFCAVLIWQLTRFVMTSYRSEDQAPTLLGTPLWIPQSLMPIGILACTVSLTRSIIGNIRRFVAA